MYPIITHREHFAAFVVGNGGAGPLLLGHAAPPERIVPLSVRFVFVRPRQSARSS
jgi:hypothetical protein